MKATVKKLSNRWHRYKYAANETDLLMEVEAVSAAASRLPLGPNPLKIQFFLPGQNRQFAAIDCLLAYSLKNRGHAVEFVYCARDLVRCLASFSFLGPDNPCEYCDRIKRRTFLSSLPSFSLTLEPHIRAEIMESISCSTIEECIAFHWRGVPIGELSQPGVIWHLSRSILTEQDVPLYVQVLQSAAIVHESFQIRLTTQRPDCVVMSNGNHYYERVVGYLCERHGIPYVCYDHSMFGHAFNVGINATTWDSIVREGRPESDHSLGWLQHRRAQKFVNWWLRRGGYQSSRYGFSGTVDTQDSRPMAVLFPNQTWESSVVNRQRVFRSMFEWVVETMRFFGEHPEWQLVIRFHPSERRNAMRKVQEPLEEVLKGELAAKPENVHLISSYEAADSYDLAARARCLLAYSSTIGLEHAFLGRKPITAANTYYSGHGFTVDPADVGSYHEAISVQMEHGDLLDNEERDRVLRFVHYFFHERPVRWDLVRYVVRNRGVEIRRNVLKRIQKGRHRELECFVDKILSAVCRDSITPLSKEASLNGASNSHS